MEKKGKDVLNIYDALALFTLGGRLQPEVVAQAGRVHAVLKPSQADRLEREVTRLGQPGDRTVMEASRQAKESGRADPPTAGQMALALKLGLAELLGWTES